MSALGLVRMNLTVVGSTATTCLMPVVYDVKANRLFLMM